MRCDCPGGGSPCLSFNLVNFFDHETAYTARFPPPFRARKKRRRTCIMQPRRICRGTNSFPISLACQLSVKRYAVSLREPWAHQRCASDFLVLPTLFPSLDPGLLFRFASPCPTFHALPSTTRVCSGSGGCCERVDVAKGLTTIL